MTSNSKHEDSCPQKLRSSEAQEPTFPDDGREYDRYILFETKGLRRLLSSEI